jgi:hypothetical protein
VQEGHFKKSHRALDVGRHRTYEVIDQICESESVELICAVLDVSRSCLYVHRERARRVEVERMARRSRVHDLFVESRSIMGMMREEGTMIRRFKVSRPISWRTSYPVFERDGRQATERGSAVVRSESPGKRFSGHQVASVLRYPAREALGRYGADYDVRVSGLGVDEGCVQVSVKRSCQRTQYPERTLGER